MLPVDYFNQIKLKITGPIRNTFLVAFCGGLIIHMFRLTNTLLTWDSSFNFYDSQNTIHLGRWFLSIACGISSYYDIQWINGLMSLLYLSLAAALIVLFFEISDPILYILTGLLFVSFPTVCSTFSYMYTADGYFLGMLLMLIGLVISKKSLLRAFLGSILFAFGMGCYQAYVSFIITLILVYFITLLLSKKNGLKQLLKALPNFLILGLVGSLLYAVIGKVLSIIEGVNLADYNGMDSMSFSIQNIPFAIKNCIIDFIYFFFGPIADINFYKLTNIVLFILITLLVAFTIMTTNNKQSLLIGNLVLSLVLAALLPLACGIIYFLSPEVRYYMLMNQGYISIYLLPIILCQHMLSEKSKKAVISSFSTFIAIGLIIYNFSLISNISYQYMEASNQSTFSLINRMVDRLEQQPEYNQIDKLCIIGDLPGFDKISYTLPPAIAGIRDGYFIDKDKHFAAIMSDRYNLHLSPVTDEEKLLIESDPIYSNMPIWPAVGSCSIKDNIAIIKFN